MADQDPFVAYCIVELFGHQKIAGRVTEQVIAGQGFVRVDVPTTKRNLPFTRLFGTSAIYSITPVSAEICQRAAESIWIEPVTAYIEPAPQLSKTTFDDDDDPVFDKMDGGGPGDTDDDDG